MYKKKKKRPQHPFRLNILFLIVFVLFALLILQLGIVQILNGESFQAEIDRTTQETSDVSVPRGLIYDRHQNLLVDNKPLYAIMYTPQKGTQAEDRLDVAEELAKYITMDGEGTSEKEKMENLSERDKREYWYLTHEDEAKELLSDEEAAELDDSEQYTEELKQIDDEEIKDLSEEELRVMLIKKELDKASYLSQHVVKNDNVSSEEYARVSEHLDKLPGIDATTDWDRVHPYDKTFNTFLGSITSKEQGIPKDEQNYYLTRGYSRNDRVGKSGLEEQYEDLLRGRKEQIEYTTDKDGNVIDATPAVEGKRGKDLVLSIDIELQEKLDEIVGKELKKTIEKYPQENKYLEDALAVAMDPQTGEILAVSGQHYDHDDGELVNAAYKTIYDQHEPGSAIKGATMLTGYQEGVISPGEVIVDEPLRIKGSDPKRSVYNMGPVDDYDALRQSSNIYMFNIGMRIGGVYNHEDGDPLVLKEGSMQTMRNNFRQFGLGNETGIDFPYESTGQEGRVTRLNRTSTLLDYVIGQFDTYTTMQLAQYVSTIANDGYRVRPHFLKDVHQPTPEENELGPVSKSFNTEVLNRVEMDERYIERVQEGFRQAFQEEKGTAYNYFADEPYKAAGKTGTSETYVYPEGERVATENLALVGYAPYDEPEIAFAVVVPHLGGLGDSSVDQRPINHNIGLGVFDTYFDLKEKRDKE